MSEVRRHIPTVCYLETAPWLFAAAERPNIVPMPVLSAEYNFGAERASAHWQDQVQILLDEWTRQGWHDRLAFRFRLFHQAGWPAKTQRDFSDYLAGIIPWILKPTGSKLDFVYAANEDTKLDGTPLYTPQELRAAFGGLGKLAATVGNWNNAEGMAWWRRIFPGPVKASIPQCYEVTDDVAFNRISDAISYNPDNCIPWLPCSHVLRDGEWVLADEETSNRYTRRISMDAVAQGVTRFGLFLHPFCEQDPGPVSEQSYRLTPRAHRYLDLVNRSIREANILYGVE